MHDRDSQQARGAARPSPPTPAELLGRRIAALRGDAGLSQEKVFLAADIPRATYQRIEMGRADVRYSHLLRIATVLRCHVRDLIP
ncbi:helix-turn-helix domain-containing protein [Streptomyces avidinii]|uniref:helix-turn-helix domain-containing protein n=1 Tax=Streptomyces avidinii TaxID=1895 RepID=UPI00386D5915|nr:helix-turn-helix domain-containing protein [Streptomyces avidinii]